MGAGGGVAAVERALMILESFRNQDKSLSLAEIAKRTGFYKSTILRLIQSLERYNYIVRGNDGSYSVGPAAWRVGMLFKNDLRMEERLMPILRELAALTNESVAIWIPMVNDAGPFRLCLQRLESPFAVSHNFRVGDTITLDPPDYHQLGTTGRVLRAFLFPTHPEDEEIRRQRVFSSYGMRDPELLGVAAPVFGPKNEVLGALTLSAPTSRRDRKWAESMKPAVLDAANRGTLALGGIVP